VEAEARKLARRDIVPDVTGLRRLGQQVCDEVAEMLMRLGNVLAPVQERCELGAVGPLLGNERIGPEDGFEPLAGVAPVVPDLGEMLKMASDLAFVPGGQDRSDVGKYLYSVARPMPACSAICDIVTDASPWLATSAAVASMCRSKIGFCGVSCVLLEFRRLGRTR